MLSQLTTKKGLAGQVTYKTNNQLINPPSETGQCYLVVFFFQNMLLNKTYHKTHNQEFLAIVEVFKNSVST